MSRLPSLRRAAMTTISIPLTAVVCLAPLPALADGSIAAASQLQLRAPLTQAPLGFKMRQFVSLQDPETPIEETPPPPPIEGSVEGPAPAQPYPPPGYYPPPPQQQAPPRGLGLLISGAAVTGAVGLPLTIYGGYIVAAGRVVEQQTGDETGLTRTGFNFVGGFFLVFGILGLGAGIPLLAIGGVRMKKYNDWKAGRQVTLTPSSGRTAHGTWTTGLKIQF